MSLNKEKAKSVESKAADGGNLIDFVDVKTLPVHDVKTDNVLELKLCTKEGVVIAKTSVDITDFCFRKPNQMAIFKDSKLNLIENPAQSGLMFFRLRYKVADSKQSEEEKKDTEPPTPKISEQPNVEHKAKPTTIAEESKEESLDPKK